jgi:BirA family biotin operon repressor/biotin-[acetyl-CoA-carboxylase] ligase
VDVERTEWAGRPVRAWQEAWGVPVLRVFGRIGSTNDLAAEMADEGAPEGATVLAEEQTAGRGRRGRAWSAPPGASLSLSMVLRPRTPDAARILTLRLGLAAAAALEEPDAPIGLKWPNDLVIGDRKVAGILCEAAATDQSVNHVVAGIGVNLAQRDDDWPEPLAGRATSLAAATGRPADIVDVAGRIVRAWTRVANDPRDTLSPDERDAFRRGDVLRGRAITVDGSPAGTAAGITERGALRVRDHHGVREIIAGTVRTP